MLDVTAGVGDRYINPTNPPSLLTAASIIYVLNYFFEPKDVPYDDKINMKRLNCFFNVYKKNPNISPFPKNIDFTLDKHVISIF